MKSFRLHAQSKREVMRSVLILLLGAAGSAAICLAALYFDIGVTRLGVMIVLLHVVLAGYLLSHWGAFRQRYPHARWLPLLVFGFFLGALGGMVRYFLPRADDDWVTSAFFIAMAVCLAVFVIINRKDPDVIETPMSSGRTPRGAKEEGRMKNEE